MENALARELLQNPVWHFYDVKIGRIDALYVDLKHIVLNYSKKFTGYLFILQKNAPPLGSASWIVYIQALI
ncbi:MAG: hypothetical protein ACTXOO_00680 [Sodalis sp. (in: enterobacteria)]